MSAPLHIQAAGMVTCVGLDAASSCAAMRARLDGFAETRFMGPGGQWLIGGAVPLPRNWIGAKRMAHLAAGALADIERARPGTLAHTPILLCLAEEDRPGRPISDADAFIRLLTDILQFARPPRVKVIAHGRPAGFAALDQTRKLIAAGDSSVIILGVDSYLTAPSLAHYLGRNRILGPGVSNGFIPGEAAAAVLLTAKAGALRLVGVGLAREPAPIYNTDDEGGLPRPTRADGMTRAHELALAEAGCLHSDLVLKMGDLVGEAYWFRQMALAMLRLQRERSAVQPIWSVAASLGNVGAAAVPVLLAWAAVGAERGYVPPGPVILEASGDDGGCGAAVVHRT